MGYTHYWEHPDIDHHTWEVICDDFINAMEDIEIPLKDLEITSEHIIFNGVGEYAHEHFVLEREEDDGFCKTNRKPYDKLVQVCLIIAKQHLGDTINVRCDDSSHGYRAGLLHLILNHRFEYRIPNEPLTLVKQIRH